MNNPEEPTPEQRRDIQRAQQLEVTALRLQQVVCALISTREYNGPNRHKVIQDAWDIIQGIDMNAAKIVLMMEQGMKTEEPETPKLYVPHQK